MLKISRQIGYEFSRQVLVLEHVRRDHAAFVNKNACDTSFLLVVRRVTAVRMKDAVSYIFVEYAEAFEIFDDVIFRAECHDPIVIIFSVDLVKLVEYRRDDHVIEIVQHGDLGHGDFHVEDREDRRQQRVVKQPALVKMMPSGAT